MCYHGFNIKANISAKFMRYYRSTIMKYTGPLKLVLRTHKQNMWSTRLALGLANISCQEPGDTYFMVRVHMVSP